jgi:hypothetical protein
MDQHMMDPLRAIIGAGVAEGRLRADAGAEFLTQAWFALLDAAIQGKIGDEPALTANPAVLARSLTDLFMRGAGTLPAQTRESITGERTTEVIG